MLISVRSIFRPTLYILVNLLVIFILASACQIKSKPDNQQATTPSSASYTTKTPHPDGTGKVYFGREIAQVMSASGAAWLGRNTRQEEENVALALRKLNLQPNSVVADIGAGTGYYTFRIAPLIPQGRINAVEVQEEFISALEKRKQELELSNVTVVKGSAQSPNLPTNSVDLAIMVDVYHELEYPQEMLQAIYKVLKPTGRLLLLEYRSEDPAVPIKELHKMSVAQVNKELKANGFQLQRREDFLPIQHFLIYEKVK